MNERKSDWSIGRRDVLKLVPQTAASWVLAAASPALTSAVGTYQPANVPASATSAESWAAKWIWETMEINPPNPSARIVILGSKSFRNVFTYFRKTVDLPASVTTAQVRISADSRYKLYVNGHYVGRGPARCTPVWQYYDTYGIAPLLQKGQNTISVLHYFYGEDTCSYMLGRPGLMFQCDLQLSNGDTMSVETDDTWKYVRSPSYAQDTPRKSGALGFVEIYDSRQEVFRWTHPGFDDSSWRNATIISKESASSDMPRVIPQFPWENLVPRDIPMLLEKEISPARVITIGEVRNLIHTVPTSLAEQMRQELPGPLANCDVQSADSLLAVGGGKAVVRTTGTSSSETEGHSAVLVFDFGREITGYPRIELDGVEGGMVDVGVSESLSDGRVTPTRNGLHCNRYVMTGGPQGWEAFEWDGFRYLQLTVRNCPQPVTLRKVAVNFTSYPVGQRGTFESSDTTLNKIWETCRYTLELCMHDAYEDCPNREQRQWIGDAYVESKVNYAVFGDTRLSSKLVRQIAQSQLPDGITRMFYPGDSESGTLAYIYIRDFVLHWISTVWEYYRFTGDAGLLRELYPNVKSAVNWFAVRIGPNGLLADVPPWIFYDWAPLDKRDESTILNALFYNVLREAAQMAAIVGESADRLRFNKLADQIKLAMNERVWDEQRGVYVDANLGGSNRSRRVSQQSNSVCLLYDIAPSEVRSRIIAYVFSQDRVRPWQGPSMPAIITSPIHPLTASVQDFDEERDVVQAQPFFMHWVNAALAHAGEHDILLALIRQNWGAMINGGATTIWETWSSDASECHGWSTTPAYDLMSFVLGVRGLTPGFGEFAVEPHPGDLEWARGNFPSVRGDISISWRNSSNEFQIEGSVPEGCSASVLIPLREKRWPCEVLLNGAVVWRDQKTFGSVNVISEKDGPRVALPPTSRYTIQARYEIDVQK
jgi:alpha-L-rhamnosidase